MLWTNVSEARRRDARKPPHAGKVYDRGMENASARDVTAFILAGGKSTRMGADKAFVEYDGRTLLARALDLARSFTPMCASWEVQKSLRRLPRWWKIYSATAGRWAEFMPRCGLRRRELNSDAGRGHAICLVGIFAVFDQPGAGCARGGRRGSARRWRSGSRCAPFTAGNSPTRRRALCAPDETGSTGCSRRFEPE